MQTDITNIIVQYENQKLDLLMKGAEYDPQKLKQIADIDKKLTKLYQWWGTEYTGIKLN